MGINATKVMAFSFESRAKKKRPPAPQRGNNEKLATVLFSSNVIAIPIFSGEAIFPVVIARDEAIFDLETDCCVEFFLGSLRPAFATTFFIAFGNKI